MPPDLLRSSRKTTSSLFLGDEDEAHQCGEPVQIVRKVIEPDFYQTNIHQLPPSSIAKQQQLPQYRWQIVWRNVLIFIFLHFAAFVGIYLLFTATQWRTILWTYVVLITSGQGITAGAHRLWAHRAYKAKLPLRIILAILQTVALQNDIYEWVRDHRVHHKFTDTDADPHNVKRGFFFSHMGWLLVKKHKDVFEKGKTVDMSDVAADPVVRFQRKYYVILTPILCFALPAWVPWYFWNEDMYVAFFVTAMFRYVLSLHGTWLVNSAAHIWGTRPYDKSIKPTENLTVSLLTNGEGWHNYHHIFPWDYKAAELGTYSANMSTAFIDLMAKIGWAYDLKSVSEEMVRKRVTRTGDLKLFSNNEHDNHHSHEGAVWGWGDKDMKSDDVDLVQIQHQTNKHQ